MIERRITAQVDICTDYPVRLDSIGPYDDGYNAAIMKQPMTANPYNTDEPEVYGRWKYGWLNANAAIQSYIFRHSI